MLSQFKRFLGDSFLYALMSVSTKLIAFIMFPIYTNLLGKQEYGVLGVLDATTGILTFLIIFGTDSALAYYYFEDRDPDKRLLYIRNIMGFRLLISISFCVLFLLIGTEITHWLSIPGFADAIQLSAFGLLLDSIIVLALTVYRYDMQAARVVLLTVLKMFLIAVLSYVFLVSFDQSVISIVYGRLLAFSLVLLFCGKQVLSFLKVRFDKEIYRKVLAYAAPLVPVSLAFWLIGSSNRYIILFLESGSAEGLGQVAIYDAAFRFASMVALFTYGIQMAWRPYSMQHKDDEDGPEMFSKIYLGILVLGLMVIMLITQIMPWAIQLLANDFYESFQFVGFLSLSTFINFYYLVLSSGLFFTKKTHSISISFGIAAGINIILNILMYTYFDLWGIVISNLITFIFATSLIFYQSQKVYYVPVSVIKMVFLLLQTILAMAGLVYLQLHAEYASWYQVFPWIYLLVSLFLCRLDRDFREVWRKQKEGES